MDAIKLKLVAELEKIGGVEIRASPVAGGSALFFHGVAFAHFHNDHELDLRLTSKVIKSLGLKHPEGSIHHPRRSRNSAWIAVRFYRSADIATVTTLVGLAVAAL